MERQPDGRVMVMVEWRDGLKTKHFCEMLHNKAPKLVSLWKYEMAVVERGMLCTCMLTWGCGGRCANSTLDICMCGRRRAWSPHGRGMADAARRQFPVAPPLNDYEPQLHGGRLAESEEVNE